MFGLLTLSLLANFASAPDFAEDGAGTGTQEPIVVEGRRGRDVERQVQRFIGALAPSGAREQLRRFEAPVCPAAAGLGEADNRAVADRIRRVAAAAGIAVAPAGCASNVFVLVAPGKAGAIRALYERDPAMFAGFGEREVAQLAASPGPAASWQIDGLMGSDGQTIMNDIEDRSWVVGLQTRVGAPTRPAFVAAFTVIEAAAIQGLTLIQVADYAALRTLIDTDPGRVRDLGTPTILGLFDSQGRPAEDAPPSLTEWDLRMLRVFYSTSNRYYGHIQRSEMQRAFLAEMEASAAESRPGDAGGRSER